MPTYGVFRHHSSKKWYALLMNIKRRQIEKDCPDQRKEDEIEIVNIKIDESLEPELQKKHGIYPGYHMNRAHWISIILDDSLADDFILELTDRSRIFASGKTKKTI
mgnify:CR=1 FL=1